MKQDNPEEYILGEGVDKDATSSQGFEVLNEARKLLAADDHPSGVTGVRELDELFASKTPSLEYEWADECPVEGLFKDHNMWRQGNSQTLILDFQKPDDLERYSSLLNKAMATDPVVLIIDEQKQFCQTAENWKVLLSIAKVQYRKVIDSKKDEK